MTKNDFVAAVAEKAGLTKKDAAAAVKAYGEAVIEVLAKGETVQLVGFGTFKPVERAAREGKNPRTGKKVKIAACKVVRFKPGKAMKDAVNK